MKPTFKLFILSFLDKELTLFSASLSFYTIFMLVPLLLIVMTFLSTFPFFEGFYEEVQRFVFSNLLPLNGSVVMKYIDTFLHNSSKIGLWSFTTLILSSFFFFQSYEYIVNTIFKTKQRNFFHSLKVYFMLLIFTPFVLGLAFSVSGYIALFMQQHIHSSINLLPLIPYSMLWLLFFILFKVSINTKVENKVLFWSSFISSSIFSLAKWGFLYYVILNQVYTTIYGSFSTVLFLFFWIYVSWMIFIYGLKLCFLLDKGENL